MKYHVTVRRTEYKETVFEVEADSIAMAEELAEEQVQDFDFGQVSVKHANEEVVGVQIL